MSQSPPPPDRRSFVEIRLSRVHRTLVAAPTFQWPWLRRSCMYSGLRPSLSPTKPPADSTFFFFFALSSPNFQFPPTGPKRYFGHLHASRHSRLSRPPPFFTKKRSTLPRNSLGQWHAFAANVDHLTIGQFAKQRTATAAAW